MTMMMTVIIFFFFIAMLCHPCPPPPPPPPTSLPNSSMQHLSMWREKDLCAMGSMPLQACSTQSNSRKAAKG